MNKVGVPRGAAHLAYNFTEIAWACVAVTGMGITFANDYGCLDANGNGLESGLIADNPYFSAALAISKRHIGPPAFQQLVLKSSAVRSIHAALKNGSKPENLVMVPDGVFLQNATDEGMKKLQPLMSEHIDTKIKKRSS